MNKLVTQIRMGLSPDSLNMPHIFLCIHWVIFSMSIQTSELPTIWKYPRIIPIHKDGDILNSQNYRSISIISFIAKKIIMRYLHILIIIITTATFYHLTSQG